MGICQRAGVCSERHFSLSVPWGGGGGGVGGLSQLLPVTRTEEEEEELTAEEMAPFSLSPPQRTLWSRLLLTRYFSEREREK